jgi:hypothetical protein
MDKGKFEKLVKEAKNAPPMFHLVHERDEGAWFPSNDAASIASIISHAWEDIQCLFEIRRKSNNDYENRLLFKYIVIELRSVIEQLEKLQSIIFHLIKGSPKDKMPDGYISEEEAEEIKALFKEYHSVKKVLEKDIINIRNSIGAHRGNHPWTNIMELWDKLEPEIFKPLFSLIPPLFDCIVKLDIYNWSRIPKDGAIEICCSGLNQP